MLGSRVLTVLSASITLVHALPSYIPTAPTSDILPTNIRRPVDKYQPDDDGKWRKVEDYELFGRRICVNCEHTGPGTVTVVIPHEEMELKTDLPPGWKQSNGVTSHPRTSVIMSLSIVIAIGISLFAVTWFNHRENRRRRLKKADLELRPSSTSSTPTSTLTLKGSRSMDFRAKMRAWASATARWKTNARYAMRQRRGKRVAETLTYSASRDTFSLRRTPSSSTSLAHSRTPSIREPTTSSEPTLAADPSSSSSRPSSPTPTPSIRPPPTPEPPESVHSPPAYHQPSQGTIPTNSMPTEKSTGGAAAPVYTPSTPSAPGPISHRASTFHVGHAATDDKAILGRMASEPLSSAAPLLHSSAPEWRDEELSEFGPESDQLPSSSHPPQASASSPAYPPPPPTHPAFLFPRSPSRSSLSSVAKGKMAMVYGASYEHYDEDGMGPSAPPFSDHCRLSNSSLQGSAPPAFDMDVSPPQLEASAPSFDDDDELYESTPQRSTAHLPLSDNVDLARRIPLPPDSHGDYEPLDMPHDPRPG